MIESVSIAFLFMVYIKENGLIRSMEEREVSYPLLPAFGKKKKNFFIIK